MVKIVSRVLVAAVIVMILSNSYVKSQESERARETLAVEGYPIESYSEISAVYIGEFNNLIISSAEKGEDWPSSPVEVALKYHGPLHGSSAVISVNKRGGEVHLEAEVRLIEDGYLDDSVRGGWLSFKLSRGDYSDPWTIEGIRQARICRRGEVKDRFISGRCP